jgi:hypothetical protein
MGGRGRCQCWTVSTYLWAPKRTKSVGIDVVRRSRWWYRSTKLFLFHELDIPVLSHQPAIRGNLPCGQFESTAVTIPPKVKQFLLATSTLFSTRGSLCFGMAGVQPRSEPGGFIKRVYNHESEKRKQNQAMICQLRPVTSFAP